MLVAESFEIGFKSLALWLHCIIYIMSLSLTLTLTESLFIIPVVCVCVCLYFLQADSQVETLRLHFQEESLEYVCKLQEIQERKKFECVEPVSSQSLLFGFGFFLTNLWPKSFGIPLLG